MDSFYPQGPPLASPKNRTYRSHFPSADLLLKQVEIRMSESTFGRRNGKFTTKTSSFAPKLRRTGSPFAQKVRRDRPRSERGQKVELFFWRDRSILATAEAASGSPVRLGSRSVRNFRVGILDLAEERAYWPRSLHFGGK
jgi:hypothetical protein